MAALSLMMVVQVSYRSDIICFAVSGLAATSGISTLHRFLSHIVLTLLKVPT